MTYERIGIIGMGTVTPAGLSATETASTVRSGVSCFAETDFYIDSPDPVVMAYLSEDILPEPDPVIPGFPGISDRQVRMLALAGPALDETLVNSSKTVRLPVVLGMPQNSVPGETPANPDILNLLGIQCGRKFDFANSMIIPKGRASGFLAMERAADLLSKGIARQVIVGGIDTYWDQSLLAELIEDGRIRSSNNMDGFLPGEGAGFLLLSTINNARAEGNDIFGVIDGLAVGFEPGHRYSQKTYMGDGLASTFADLFRDLPNTPRIKTVYAGFNGENFDAKQWGTAYARNEARFADEYTLEHPADCIGDTGAAMATIMLVLSVRGMQVGCTHGPCLVWSTSDHGDCGALVVGVAL
jgi:3-oxoacyl-[acyl-carrier-protein] synthase-1